MTKKLVIDYYSDVLCVWAWIAQKRLDQLTLEWGEQIEFRFHYLNLFADTQQRIGQGWADKGGFAGFSKHVIEVATPFIDSPVNKSIWLDVRPKTSMTAHLMLKALTLCEGAEAAAKYSVKLRHAFFADNQDISNNDVLLSHLIACGHPTEAIQESLNNGSAAAALAGDYQRAAELGIKGSPSWIMNNGRQTLYGNVGFRVLNANIRENLEQNDLEASWC
jgi:predicted DsbA family dithiol-disulfide isomerase